MCFRHKSCSVEKIIWHDFILLLETHPFGYIYLSMSFSHQDLYIYNLGEIF